MVWYTASTTNTNEEYGRIVPDDSSGAERLGRAPARERPNRKKAAGYLAQRTEASLPRSAGVAGPMEDVGSQGQLCLAIEADVDQIFEERAVRAAGFPRVRSRSRPLPSRPRMRLPAWQRRLARARRSSQRPTVCKYWLRGLCSKACVASHFVPSRRAGTRAAHALGRSDGCEFLHRYDPDRMAECQFYARYGECSAAEDCPFRHTRRGGPKAQVGCARPPGRSPCCAADRRDATTRRRAPGV